MKKDMRSYSIFCLPITLKQKYLKKPLDHAPQIRLSALMYSSVRKDGWICVGRM